jgi:hypothetical protein
MTDNDTYEYVTTGNVNTLPMDASPTDVMDTEAGWRVSQHLPMRAKEIEKLIKRNFMEYLGSQEEHVAQVYTQIEFFVVPYEIYEMLKSTRNVNIATDGGAIPFKGSI